MGWDKSGRYYTRSKRVNGRVVREYVGGGTIGQLFSQHDALEREKCRIARAAFCLEREGVTHFDELVQQLNTQADLFVRVALAATGYEQHNRGEWRKKRVHKRNQTNHTGGKTRGGNRPENDAGTSSSG